jgi:prepilin-type N-terminal cleavage/methylation domain-containing protein
MKKSAFTLIELIFVILIIGVLSAVAVPKFKNLKQNAESSNVLKVANDAFSAVPSSYVNLVDMEELDGNITLDNLVSIDGKNWTVNTTTAIYADNNDSANHTVATLTFNPGSRNVTLDIDCTKFIDTTTQAKCSKNNGGDTSSKTLDF